MTLTAYHALLLNFCKRTNVWISAVLVIISTSTFCSVLNADRHACNVRVRHIVQNVKIQKRYCTMVNALTSVHKEHMSKTNNVFNVQNNASYAHFRILQTLQFVTSVHRICLWTQLYMGCVKYHAKWINMGIVRLENVIHVRFHVMSVILQRSVNRVFLGIWFIRVSVSKEMNAWQVHISTHSNHNVSTNVMSLITATV